MFKGRCIENQFSFFYKACKWGQNAEQFCYSDSFVLNNPQYYKLLKECHFEIQTTKNYRKILALKAVTHDHMKNDLRSMDIAEQENRQDGNDEADNFEFIMVESETVGNIQTGVNNLQITSAQVAVTSAGTLALQNYILTDLSNSNWHIKVLNWWNDWVINGYRHKKKQLYLWGPPNTGKSTFILRLIELSLKQSAIEEYGTDNSVNVHLNCEDQIMRPTPNDKCFAWQSFNEEKHNVVIMEEFHISEYCVADLKKLLAGETFVANVKNGRSKKIKLQMPMILISNFEPPCEASSVEYRGIMERLHVITADELIRY